MIRLLRVDHGTEIVAVVQAHEGESKEDAWHRADIVWAEKVRAAGIPLGDAICEMCSRPPGLCQRDPATCMKRASKRSQTQSEPSKETDS